MPTKNTLKLKGIVYLPGCKTKDNPKSADTFILSGARKEYVLSSVSENPTADILSWRNSLDYAIEQSDLWKEENVVTGWLMKKGGKGHTYQNWKRRWFILRGNIVFYYEDKDDELEESAMVKMEKLKGFIEVSMITDIDTDLTSDGNGFQFIVTVNNDKSYIFATKSMDEKNMWVSALRERIEKFSKNSLQVSLNTCSLETFVKSGELKRHISIKRSTHNYFVLTNINLRVYVAKPDLATISENWGKGMVACIPLLGCSIQCSEDSDEWDLKQNEMAIIEIQGHAYVLETQSVQERIDWVTALKTSARNLAKQVVGAGETIRLTCNASDKNDHNAGYTILTIDSSKITLKYLMLKKVVVIPFDKLKLVFLQPGFLFCLKYVQGEKAKQLKMKCGNANGIFEAVEAIFELVGANNPDRLQRHSAKALAHPSLSGAEVAAATSSGKSDTGSGKGSGKKANVPRKLTKELILTQRQSDDAALTSAAAAASIPGAAIPSFSDFHYESAPTPSKKHGKKGKDAQKHASKIVVSTSATSSSSSSSSNTTTTTIASNSGTNETSAHHEAGEHTSEISQTSENSKTFLEQQQQQTASDGNTTTPLNKSGQMAAPSSPRLALMQQRSRSSTSRASAPPPLDANLILPPPMASTNSENDAVESASDSSGIDTDPDSD